MSTVFFRIGAVSAGTAVALGAFGAHGLRAMVSPEMMAVFETGVRYQMYHALALLALGLGFARLQGRMVTAAAWLFVAGTVLFSGSLYVLTLTGTRWWGAVTPLGGVAFLAGWGLLLTARVSGSVTGER
jgi:uncharacterized membrane protein YgdD (TMEM256/DUF423 family)